MNENDKLKDANSNSLNLIGDLQTENDRLRDSRDSSNLLNDFKFVLNDDVDDEDELSIEDLASVENGEEKSMQRILQSISNLKREVRAVENRDIQSQLSKLTGQVEVVAKDALRKSKK